MSDRPPTANLVFARGTLSGPPRARELPSGSSVIAYDVTVPRPDGERADTVPVSWFDPPAAAYQLEAGDEVCVAGRVSRRFFRQPGGTGSRTDVVAHTVVPVRRRAQVRRLLEQLADTVTELREHVT